MWSFRSFYQKGAFDGNAAGNPETIADFFDVKNFPGKRGLHTWGNASIEMALMADGVAPGDVYDTLSTPEGVDRAFAKLDTIKDVRAFEQYWHRAAEGEWRMTLQKSVPVRTPERFTTDVVTLASPLRQ